MMTDKERFEVFWRSNGLLLQGIRSKGTTEDFARAVWVLVEDELGKSGEADMAPAPVLDTTPGDVL